MKTQAQFLLSAISRYETLFEESFDSVSTILAGFIYCEERFRRFQAKICAS
jgi:hypothetical protein